MEHIVLNINGREYGVEVEKDWQKLKFYTKYSYL